MIASCWSQHGETDSLLMVDGKENHKSPRQTFDCCVSSWQMYTFFDKLVVVVQSLSPVQLFVAPWTATCQASLSLLSPRVCSHTCPLSRWCHPTISSSVIPFSCFPQSFLAPGSFPMRWLFALGSQSIGASASTSVLQVNIQCWFPLGWTGLISFQSKGLSRIFSSTTVQKHQFFGAQPSWWSKFYLHIWLLEKP